jgi:ABC-type transporter Mla subunit MlaD
MTEEQKRPALKEIPVRDMKGNHDSERQIISLMNSLKDNFDAKLVALRKDIEQKSQEHVANEIKKVQDAMEKLRTESADARKGLAEQVAALVEKIDKFNAVTPDENAKFKAEVQATLDQVQTLTSKFDLTIFVKEIRESFAAKLQQAEQKAKELSEQAEKAQMEMDQLKKVLGEKDLQAQQEIAQLKRSLSMKDVEPHRFPPTTSSPASRPTPATAPLPRIPPTSPPTPVPSYLQRGSPFEERDSSYGNQTDQGQKSVQYCKNCGKTRSRSSARFCIYCGSEF